MSLQKVPELLQDSSSWRTSPVNADAPRAYSFGPFRLEVAEQRLLRDGQPVPLTPKIFDVLRILVENAGHLVAKDRLLAEVWAGSFVEDGSLARSISVLRKTLGPGEYIETHPKRGYRFVAEVTPCSAGTVPGPGADERMPKRAVLPAIARPVAAVVIGCALIGVVVTLMLTVSGRRRNGPAQSAAAGGTPVHRQVTFRGREGSAALSPDGGRIAYVSMVSADEHVLVIQALPDGPPLQVFTAPELARPRWSPDGTQLLFWARGGGKDGIYLTTQFGSIPRPLGTRVFACGWAPDGSAIVLARTFVPALVLVDRDGRELRNLPLLGGIRWISDLDWFGDRLVIAAADQENRHSLWTIGADGTGQRRVLTESTEISSVRWDPRGEALYYLRRLRQTSTLFKLPMASSATSDRAAPVALLTGLDSDGTIGLAADAKSLVYTRAPFHSNLWMAETAGAGPRRTTRTSQLT